MCPVTVYDRKNGFKAIPCPCGRCPACVRTRASQWGFRLMFQYMLPDTTDAFFVTLTYDNDHLPGSDNGLMTLNYDHLTAFFKRLRYLDSGHGKGNIKYWAVGEYGTRFKRPHYHIILFNACADDILASWPMGHVYLGAVTGASIGYCFKYLGKSSKVGREDGDDRAPERSRMSKGIGKEYLTADMVEWHRSDLMERMYVRAQDGKRVSMPRYFKDRIYTKEERELIGQHVAAMRAQDLEKLIDELGMEVYLHEKVEYEKYRFEKLRASSDALDSF